MIAALMGWIGTVGTIGAYWMLSRGHWRSSSLRYAALNAVGGLLAAGASAAYGAWPSVASNLLWTALATQSIVVTLHTRRALSPCGAHVISIGRVRAKRGHSASDEEHVLLDAA